MKRLLHSFGKYVRNMAHTNGMKSFWVGLKCGYQETYHKMLPKHLNHYINEFEGCHNYRLLDTIDQMSAIVTDAVGKWLWYKDLIADNSLPSGAKS